MVILFSAREVRIGHIDIDLLVAPSPTNLRWYQILYEKTAEMGSQVRISHVAQCIHRSARHRNCVVRRRSTQQHSSHSTK